jgi:hypothetical protein
MILDLITYIIIVSAFLYAGYKILCVFKPGKNQKKHKAASQKHHTVEGCDDCPAECSLRDYNLANASKKVEIIKDF